MGYTLSQRLSHFFHVVSNIRPIVWIGLYVCATPIFALIYWGLPTDQFRMPEGAPTDYGAWLYYSIVTITTLGFGDYTPAHPGAQAVTAVEVMCGLIFLGLFLNAVGSMKSEIDVETELETQRKVHLDLEHNKLLKSVPMVMHSLNTFLAYCYAVTTPKDRRDTEEARYNPDFTINDLSGLFKPTGLSFDNTKIPAVERLMHSASQTSLVLDSLQQRVDLSLWPRLLEGCFSFVANCEMFSHEEAMFRNPRHYNFPDMENGRDMAEKDLERKISSWEPATDIHADPELKAVAELMNFIKENASIAMSLETTLTSLAMEKNAEVISNQS